MGDSHAFSTPLDAIGSNEEEASSIESSEFRGRSGVTDSKHCRIGTGQHGPVKDIAAADQAHSD